jgi:hypothetical protein
LSLSAGYSAVFFSYNKSASAAATAETISRTIFSLFWKVESQKQGLRCFKAILQKNSRFWKKKKQV